MTACSRQVLTISPTHTHPYVLFITCKLRKLVSCWLFNYYHRVNCCAQSLPASDVDAISLRILCHWCNSKCQVSARTNCAIDIETISPLLSPPLARHEKNILWIINHLCCCLNLLIFFLVFKYWNVFCIAPKKKQVTRCVEPLRRNECAKRDREIACCWRWWLVILSFYSLIFFYRVIAIFPLLWWKEEGTPVGGSTAQQTP